MNIKNEIKKSAEEFFYHISSVEIATLKAGLVAVWINGKRFGNYDLNKHEFVSLMA